MKNKLLSNHEYVREKGLAPSSEMSIIVTMAESSDSWASPALLSLDALVFIMGAKPFLLVGGGPEEGRLDAGLSLVAGFLADLHLQEVAAEKYDASAVAAAAQKTLEAVGSVLDQTAAGKETPPPPGMAPGVYLVLAEGDAPVLMIGLSDLTKPMLLSGGADGVSLSPVPEPAAPGVYTVDATGAFTPLAPGQYAWSGTELSTIPDKNEE